MNAYSLAVEQYAAVGVDVEAALATLKTVSISLHCWQGDDVAGFDQPGGLTDAGIQATGSYPGRARTPEELRADLEKAFSLIPGKHRLNLHASYAEAQGRNVDRNAYTVAEFEGWIGWCEQHGLGFDFNPTYFAHPHAASGMTLAHPDAGIRRFWVEHAIACRRIAGEAGRRLGQRVTVNHWIPDGSKDVPFDRATPRRRLRESLDAIFAERLDPVWMEDAVESKLFGLGSEAYVVGSHEFYLGYAIRHQLLYCLDMGHFHPTENLADKISALFSSIPALLLHVSRGVRWDSDHVVLFDDATRSLMEELVRGGYLSRTRIGLDFFDASINRVAAWVIGTRNTLKALLAALLEPAARLREAEEAGDFTARLAWLEESRLLPLGAVWDEHCRRQNVPVGLEWLEKVREYERAVLSRR